MTAPPLCAAPPLPKARGEVSAAVLDRLTAHPRTRTGPMTVPVPKDPYGDDLQLSLYLLYELHYRGFEGVDDRLEWDPDLLRLRAALEDRFLAALRDGVPRGGGAEEELAALMNTPPDGKGSVS
ncbi:iron-containing redox enzyme family protein, partial [Streptomyces sp. NPDC003832]